MAQSNSPIELLMPEPEPIFILLHKSDHSILEVEG